MMADQLELRDIVASGRRWVIKIGSALLTDDGAGLDAVAMANWAGQIASLRARGVEVVLVSSGAVAEGMTRLGWRHRPEAVHDLQAAAAVGQMGLVQAWQEAFARFQLHTAQVLLVHDDLSDRKRYLNARRTLQTLLSYGVIPVVNENDTVATDEIRFGDNDTLGGVVANLIDADVLAILTDQCGLFERDPRHHADAGLIVEAEVTDRRLDAYVSGGAGVLGRGGMLTKLRAARLAARSGTQTLIAGGRESDILLSLAVGEPQGSWLKAEQPPKAARKRWLSSHLQTRGALFMDAGAARVVERSGGSLLAVGVVRIEGEFGRGEMVSCMAPDGRELARGLVNFSAEEAGKIIGLSSDNFSDVLGYHDDDELIHRDNLVLV
jgi:glutamate 5-kinase